MVRPRHLNSSLLVTQLGPECIIAILWFILERNVRRTLIVLLLVKLGCISLMRACVGLRGKDSFSI